MKYFLKWKYSRNLILFCRNIHFVSKFYTPVMQKWKIENLEYLYGYHFVDHGRLSRKNLYRGLKGAPH
jgi:hypothetical protein